MILHKVAQYVGRLNAANLPWVIRGEFNMSANVIGSQEGVAQTNASMMVPSQVACRTTNSVEGKIYDYFLVHSNLAAITEPPDVLAAAGLPTHAP
eukprot:6438703-Pyramimonas_sp.AAC.1